MLESLNLYFDGRGGNWYNNFGYWYPIIDPVQIEALFRNYLAIGKLLLKYKDTLKEVQIERVFFGVQTYTPHLFQPQWTEMERGLETLDELSLNRLKVSTIASYRRYSPMGKIIYFSFCLEYE